MFNAFVKVGSIRGCPTKMQRNKIVNDCVVGYIYIIILYTVYTYLWDDMDCTKCMLMCVLSILYISLNSWNSIVYHCVYMHIDNIDSIVDTYKYAYILIHIYINKYIYKHLILLIYSHVFLYCTWCCYGWRDGTAPGEAFGHGALPTPAETGGFFSTGFHGWGLPSGKLP